jgi:hypothetical protein
MRPTDTVTLSSPKGLTRWSKYLVKGEIVYAAGLRAKPLATLSLPSQLARAAGRPGNRVEERVPELLAFYRAFGFLAPTERLWPTKGGRRSVRSSESIAWALRHASNVQTIMALHGSRGDELDGLLAALVDKRPVLARAWRGDLDLGERAVGWMTVPGPRESDPLRRFTPKRRQGESALAFSRRLIAELLNPNLAAVRRTYDPAQATAGFEFDCLIDVVYWQLADALTVGDLRQCRCGRLFFAQDARQRVCPPLPPRRESACGVRFRTQKWRNKPYS